MEVGIVYKEYMNILADAQLEVNLYSQSAEFAKETNVISSMETILRHYKLAGMVWDSMITGSPPPPETQKIFEARMQYHWREASMELLQLSQHLKSYK